MSRYPLRTVYIHLVRVFREYREGETFLQTNGRRKKMSLKRRSKLFYLSWNFEFLHHPELEEAADATFDELKLRQGEVAEAEFP